MNNWNMERAKIINDGDDQMVILPPEYHLDADHVFVTRKGSSVMLLSNQKAWDVIFQITDEITDDFMEERHQVSGNCRKTKLDESQKR
jgi:virulence-associated protein VagC